MEYSILVHQYALTGDAFTFWENLKNNTENLGSIFDAQPSEISGNIHNVNNPAQPAVGYVSVCTVQSKRIFIHNQQLPRWQTTYPYNCQADSVLYCSGADCVNQVALELIPIQSPTIPTTALGPDYNPYGFWDQVIHA
jgi:hypothetical protein